MIILSWLKYNIQLGSDAWSGIFGKIVFGSLRIDIKAHLNIIATILPLGTFPILISVIPGETVSVIQIQSKNWYICELNLGYMG